MKEACSEQRESVRRLQDERLNSTSHSTTACRRMSMTHVPNLPENSGLSFCMCCSRCASVLSQFVVACRASSRVHRPSQSGLDPSRSSLNRLRNPGMASLGWRWAMCIVDLVENSVLSNRRHRTLTEARGQTLAEEWESVRVGK